MISPAADGRCTCIASARDYGYATWLDTDGLRDMQIIVRWQGLPRQTVRGGPRLSVRIVKVNTLEELTEAELPRITAEQWQAELRDRAAAFERRFDVVG